jgi:hypothetical protein
MNNLQITSIVAGFFFGVAPLLLNKSGLNGNLSSGITSAIILVCVLPFALSSIVFPTTPNWWMAIGSALAATCGILLFNGVVSKASPLNIGTLFVLMLIMQVAVPAIYQIIVNGGISLTKGVGFILAITAAVLLLKS